MTDRKVSAKAGQNDEDALPGVALFSHESDDTDTNLHRLDVAPRASQASYSLGRLEQDLKLLNSKWRAVEQEMSERDEQISALQQELDSYEKKSSALETEVANITADKTSLSADLAATIDEMDAWRTKGQDFDHMLLARDAEIDSVRRGHESLLEQKRQLESDFAEQEKSASTAVDHLAELESQNVELRVHIQELQDYIDGRKGDWDNLNAQMRKYENTIQGISSSIEAHDKVVAEKEEEKAGLALKVMELERSLAELKGRLTERESSQVELQQTLDDQSRELGSLNGEAIRHHKDIEKLQKKLDRRDATLRTLRRDLKDRNRDSSSLEGLLASEKATIAELQANLKSADRRIADLETEQKEHDSNADEFGVTIGELRERLRQSQPTIDMHELRITDLENSLRASEATAKELCDEVANAALKLEQMSGTAAEHEIRAAELHAVLLETESEKKDSEKELDAQRELVHVLEFELSNKQENLDVLDRSVDRLSAIGSGIHDLDVRIDEHWCEQPEKSFEQSEGLFEQPEEVLVQPEELFADPEELIEHVLVSEADGSGEPVRYPLTQKEITIGRSHNSDIRINSKYISRVHARIRVDGSCVTIEDAGSTNGFLVNSVHKTHHTLAHGDKLEIGKNKFQYLDTSSA